MNDDRRKFRWRMGGSILLSTIAAVAFVSANDDDRTEIQGGHPISLDIQKDTDHFECAPTGIPVTVCVEKLGFPDNDQRSLLRSAMSKMYINVMANKSVRACMADVAGSKPLLNALYQYIVIDPKSRETNPNKNPSFYLVGFQKATEAQFTNYNVYAFRNYFHARAQVNEPSVLIGINRKLLGGFDAAMGSSVDFWSAMLFLGILENLGFSEGSLDIVGSVPNRLMQCLFFEGTIPAEFALPTEMKFGDPQ